MSGHERGFHDLGPEQEPDLRPAPSASNTASVQSGRTVKLILTNFDEKDAVLVDGDTVSFVTAFMAVDKPYVFRWLSDWRVAVKREDGSMDVYVVPKHYDSMLSRLSKWLKRAQG